MRRLLIAVIGALILAAPASASSINASSGWVSFTGESVGETVTAESVSANQIRVISSTSMNASGGCSPATGTTVTCTVTQLRADMNGLDGNDNLTVVGGVLGFLNGNADDDQLQGGDGDDTLTGGTGQDTIDGGGGEDWIEGQDDADILDGEEGEDWVWMVGADTVRDSGAAGTSDILDFGNFGGPVTVTVNDGQANDGGTGEVLGGFEEIAGGSGSDSITGSPAAEILRGNNGNDTLTGGGGADELRGQNNDDTLRLDDGAADRASDCGSGTDSATIDASDSVVDCENVTTVPTSGGSGTGGNSGGGSTGGGGPASGGTPPPSSSVETTTVSSSVRTTPMPDVVGKDVAKARAALDAAVPNVDIVLVFNRKCGGKQTLDVIKQNPAAGQPITTSESQVARTSLDVCVPDKRFLADCDRRDLAKDIAQLPAKGDAGMASQLLLRLGKCQTDVDVSLSGGAVPAMSFDDLRRKGGKGAIEATLHCSKTQHDFAVALGEGLQVGNAGDASFALGEQGGKWVLPGDERALKSIVEIQVQQRTSGLQRSEVYVDADDVKPTELRPGQVFVTDAGGHASLFVRPTKPGKIRVCVVQRAGEAGLATWSAEIQVVRGPKTGKVWQTVNGRHLLLTEQGRGKLVDPPKARMAALGDVWNWILSLFGRKSRTVNTEAASPGSVSLKAPKVFQTARVGIAQITLDGTLTASPAPPLAQQGPCLIWDNGTLRAARCPTLVAPGGHAVVGISSDGSPMVAAGGGNVIAKAVDPRDAGRKLIGTDGSSLIGTDGSSLIGTDGSSLIGTDGSSLIGLDGASFQGPGAPAIVASAKGGIAAMAPQAIAIDRAKLIGTDGSSLIGTDGSSLIGTDGSSLVSDNGLG